MTFHEMVNHPSHYQLDGMEVMDVIDAGGFGVDFCIGNALKYLLRAGRKTVDPVTDWRKAVYYIDHAIELVEGKENE